MIVIAVTESGTWIMLHQFFCQIFFEKIPNKEKENIHFENFQNFDHKTIKKDRVRITVS